MRQLKISKSITNRESLTIDKYLGEIGKYSLLSSDEEISLSKRVQQGDKAAMDRLVRANLRFVVSVAKQYQNQGLALSDLINEGNIGLIKAAERFDETRGFKFISYAVWWIRQHIMLAINEQARIVRVPINQVYNFGRYQKAVALFEQVNERMPSVEEIAEIVNVSAEKLNDSLICGNKHVSMDAPLQDDGISGSMLDVMESTESKPADGGLIKESLHVDIHRAISTLNEREELVVCLSYGIGVKEESLDAIGARFGISGERVRQIRERALRRIRVGTQSSTLRAYLG